MKPTQLPSGSWRCKVYIGRDDQGKPKYQSITRTNYYECLEEAAKLAKHHHEIERNPSMMTLRESIDKYISIKDGILSPSTIANYATIQKYHLQKEMNLPLSKLTNNTIQAAINRESKFYSPKTVENVYRLITAVVNQFSDQSFNITLPEKIEKDHNMLSDDQIAILIQALRGDKSEIPILLALFLGLRRSEILALTHDDYDPQTKTLSITKAMVPNKNKEFVIKGTKTAKSKRKISVPSYLADRLEAYIESGTNFYSVAVERPYKRLQQICAKYQLPRISLHDLRHQNASIMLLLGIPDKYAMERGGWASPSVMKKIYQHTIDQKRKTVDDLMEDYFERVTK